MDLGLKDAAVVVVGGGRGMGRATARCFAREGARVAVISRTSADTADCVRELREDGSPDPVGLVADARSRQSLQGAVVELESRWGPEINVLVNATGPDVRGAVTDLSDEQWQQAYTDGVLPLVHAVTAALPGLRAANWARVVNFSASSTKRQTVSLAAYTAAKAAVTSLSKNLAMQLAREEILVNVISPGSVASESLLAWARSVGEDSTDPYELAEAIDRHFGHGAHLPRVGMPAEIGPVVTFLGSRVNSYMTGANVNVDGGTDFT